MKPERAILEANMGGDKKPSFEYFQSGHGKTGARRGDADRGRGAAGAADEARRPRRARLGGHARRDRLGDAVGRVHAGDSAIAAVFAATGQDLGMVGTSSMAHGAAPPRRGRPAGLDPAARARGGDDRRRHDAPVRASLARAARLRRRRQGLPLRPDRRRGDAALGSRPLRRWRRRARPSSSARTTSAADFAETSDRTVGRVSSR